MPERGATVAAGASLGLVGMLIFGIYHWFYVAPVIAPFLEGILWGGGAGALVGLSYHQAIPARGRNGWRWDLLFGAAMVSALVPYEVVGLVWGPFEEITRPEQILPMLPITLVGVPVLAFNGWALTRNRRATATFIGAGFILHFFIGGSAAHFGGRGQTLALVLLMGCFELLAALSIGPLGNWMARRSRSLHPEPFSNTTDPKELP